MKNFSLLVLIASLAFIAGAGLTYVAKTPWTADMANQPSIKPQEWPLLPPESSVATDLVSNSGTSGNMTGSQASHQAMDHQHGPADSGGHQHGSASKEKAQGMAHQHGTSGRGGHQHEAGTAKHDHGPKADPEGMGHQHGTSGAGAHQHDGATAEHDHGSKSTSPAPKKDSQPLPTDLMGSTGMGPGKALRSPGGREKAGNQGTGGHDHDSKPATKAPAKDSQHNHSSMPHSHAPSAAHDHGTSKSDHQHSQSAPHKHGATGHSHGKENPEKMKSGVPSSMHQHNHGTGAGDGHAHGEMPAQIVNPIKATEGSVKRGQQLFNIYCAVCHGNEGRGGAPMEKKLTGIPKFTADLLRSVDDNHMFSMITSGHGPMPGYAEALTPEERWHVANYVRTLQKKLSSEKEVAQGVSR